jgi:hypothetical protein
MYYDCVSPFRFVSNHFHFRIRVVMEMESTAVAGLVILSVRVLAVMMTLILGAVLQVCMGRRGNVMEITKIQEIINTVMSKRPAVAAVNHT